MKKTARMALLVALLAALLCASGCVGQQPAQQPAQQPTQKSAQKDMPARTQVQSLSDVPDALNKVLPMLPNCNLHVSQVDNRCVVYNGKGEVGFIEFYPDDDSFAVFSPKIDADNYESVSTTVNMMIAVTMACNASLDVNAAKMLVASLVENDELRDGGVNYTVGTQYDHNVIRVEL